METHFTQLIVFNERLVNISFSALKLRAGTVVKTQNVYV